MFQRIKSFVSRRLTLREMGKRGFISSRKRLRSDDTLRSAAEQSKTLGIFMLFLVGAACVTVQVLPMPKTIGLQLVPKQKAPQSIFADFDFRFENVEETHKKRDEAKADVPLYYKTDPEAVARASKVADEFFEEILKRAAALEKGKTYQTAQDKRGSVVAAGMDPEALMDITQIAQNVEYKEKMLKSLESSLEEGVIRAKEKEGHSLGQKIRVIDAKERIRKPKPSANVMTPAQAAERTAEEMAKYFSQSEKDMLKSELAEAALGIIGDGGSLVLDEQKTEKNRSAEAALVQPVMREIKKGQPIITKDQTVGAEDLSALKLYFEELQKRTESHDLVKKFAQSFLITLFLMVITGIYVSHIHPEVLESNHKIWLIGTVVIISVFLNYLLMKNFNFVSPIFNIPPAMVTEIVPLALPAVLLSVLIGLRVAVYMGIFVSIIAALVLDQSFTLFIEGMFASCLAGFMVRHSTNYRAFFLRSLCAVPLTLGILVFTFLWDIRGNSEILQLSLTLSVINGLLTATISLLLLFFLESLFQVSTNMTLLMYCDFNHPLMKRLQFEAPGTYHHSIMVANLSEQAAHETGANPIKARVASLYHDIGKLSKPSYFTENNMGGENKHKELHPRMSSMIILNHVKEGVDMAIKYKLRKIIRDAIEQHHGTDLVRFFYQRALEENKDKSTPVEEQEYRYPGPLPREKEVVIVSLADACEAASRTLEKPTHGKIDALVGELFRKRIRDGQLDEAKLTFGEMAKVKNSFVKTLTTMLHVRVAYPKGEEDDDDEDDLFMAAKRYTAARQEDDKQTPDRDD